MYLSDIDVVLGLAQAVGEFFAQATCTDGLHCKGGVPELRAIVALHLHAILSHPQEVVQPGDVPAASATSEAEHHAGVNRA